MAIFVVHLTRRQRYILAITFISLNIIQSILGFIIILWSIYICIAVAPVLYSEKSEVKFVFSVLGLYGTHVVIYNLIGIKICQKCYFKAHKKSTKRILFLWSLAGCNILFNLLILALMTVKISKHIIRTMRHSLEKGMSSYLKDHFWKYTIDTLQVKYKCCGIKSYLDWYKTVWMDEYHVNSDNDLVKKFRTSTTDLQLPITPWSCCRTDFPMQCFHDPLQQISFASFWKDQPSTITNSIYNDGCLTLLRKPIEMALSAFILITITLLVLEIVTILISRLVFTSCKNAVILRDTTGVAPGWIFGRGDCGWSRGPTLYDIIMGASNSGETPGSSTVESKSPKSSEKPTSSRSSRMTKLLNKFKKNKWTPRSDEDPVSSNEEKALLLN